MSTVTLPSSRFDIKIVVIFMRLRIDFSANHRLDSLRVFTLIVDLVFTRLNACKIMWLRSKWWECRLIYIKSSFAQSKTSSTIIFYLLSIHLIFPHHPEQRRGIKANRRTTVKPLPLAHIMPPRFRNMIIFMSTVILTQFRFDIKISRFNQQKKAHKRFFCFYGYRFYYLTCICLPFSAQT